LGFGSGTGDRGVIMEDGLRCCSAFCMRSF
jgi:hypothetical protein